MGHPLDRTLDRLWAAKLRPAEDFSVFLASPPQPGALVAAVPPRLVWGFEPVHHKLRAVLDRSWTPQFRSLQRAGGVVLLDELLGDYEDFGPHLLRTLVWHHARPWDHSAATPDDRAKAAALSNFSCAVRIAFKDFGGSVPPLNLKLADTYAELEPLLYAMVLKVPVVSLRYGLDLMADHTFAQVRASQHPHADEIIAYLYELVFLQQKTCLAMLDFLKLGHETRETKRESVLTLHELQQILRADVLVPYLKATVEKTLCLIGATFGIHKLDEKKTHAARLTKLRAGIPAHALSTFYAKLLLAMVEPQKLAAINSLRSGLMHKRGIARLQPHSYSGIAPHSLSDLAIFAELQDQHRRNTAGLVAAIAMLTDDLVRRDPPLDRPGMQLELARLRHGSHPLIG